MPTRIFFASRKPQFFWSARKCGENLKKRRQNTNRRALAILFLLLKINILAFSVDGERQKLRTENEAATGSVKGGRAGGKCEQGGRRRRRRLEWRGVGGRDEQSEQQKEAKWPHNRRHARRRRFRSGASRVVGRGAEAKTRGRRSRPFAAGVERAHVQLVELKCSHLTCKNI